MIVHTSTGHIIASLAIIALCLFAGLLMREMKKQ